MKKILIASFLSLLLLPVFNPTALSFNFAVRPSIIDVGTVAPGESYEVSFRAMTGAEQEVNIDITTGKGTIDYFGRLNNKEMSRFSEQDCNCLRVLRGTGTVEEKDESVKAGEEEVDKWQDVEFILEVPEDIEPGHHLLTVTPKPTTSGSGTADVGVTSAATVPVSFEVPGPVERSGKFIGIRSEYDGNGRERIISRFRNTGNVTIRTSVKYEIKVDGENKTFNVGTREVSPGESAEFSQTFNRNDLNKTFSVKTVSNYTTGSDTMQKELSLKEPVQVEVEESGLPQGLYLLITLIIITISSIFSWKLIKNVRR